MRQDERAAGEYKRRSRENRLERLFLRAKQRFPTRRLGELTVVRFRTLFLGGSSRRKVLCEFDDRLRDRRFRSLIDQRHAIVSYLGHRSIVVWQLPEDFATDGFL